MIGVTAAASAAAYYMRGYIVASIAGPVALGSVLGAVLGARILVRISGRHVRILFITILLILGLQMLLHSLGAHFLGIAA